MGLAAGRIRIMYQKNELAKKNQRFCKKELIGIMQGTNAMYGYLFNEKKDNEKLTRM